MTTTYTCEPFRPIRDGDRNPRTEWIIESAQDAAAVFAGRMARRQYGNRGYCHHVRRDVVSADGRYANYEAFIGVAAHGGGTNGHNVWLTVYSEPPKPPGRIGAWD